MVRFVIIVLAIFWSLPACSGPTDSADVRIGVATNFKPVLDQLETRFETQTDYQVETVTGSTGALYAQIINGAPFDVFLAADQGRPMRLEEAGFAVKDTRFTYATGVLALWRAEGASISLDALSSPDLRKLAIANRELAPYGKAAWTALEHLGLTGHFTGASRHALVLGENVGHTFAFVKTGNAELGLVALSQILALPEAERGAYIMLDKALHNPIRQDAQLLTRAEENQAAKAFLTYLASPEAIALIAQYGYRAP